MKLAVALLAAVLLAACTSPYVKVEVSGGGGGATQGTVLFDANGGTGTLASQTADLNTTVTLSTNTLTYTGFTFSGWNTKADGTGTACADGATFTIAAASTTLYAQWVAAEPPKLLSIDLREAWGFILMTRHYESETQPYPILEATHLISNYQGLVNATSVQGWTVSPTGALLEDTNGTPYNVSNVIRDIGGLYQFVVRDPASGLKTTYTLETTL